MDSNLQVFTMFTWEGGRLKAGSSKGGVGLAEKWRSWTPSAPRVCRDTGRCRIAFNPDGLRWQGTSGRARAFYELLARLKFVRIYPATSLSAARGKGKSRDNKKESRIAANSPSLLSFLFFSQSWAFLSELKELTS